MCLGIPGKVLTVYETGGMRMAEVDFGGIKKEICLAYVPEVGVGDYTIVHVGFAITRLDEDEAMETLQLIREMGMLEEELGAGAESGGLASDVVDGDGIENRADGGNGAQRSQATGAGSNGDGTVQTARSGAPTDG